MLAFSSVAPSPALHPERLPGLPLARLPPSMLTCATPLTKASTVCEGVLELHAPGRLHLGFLDPSGTLGRAFGSLGLVIDGFETVLELRAAAVDEIDVAAIGADADADADAARVRQHVQKLRSLTGCDQPLHWRLLRVLPAHAGFGSGTQLALAVGRAFAQWHGLQIDTATLARWLGRGRRSGIGIAAFDQGGLLLDGGPGADGSTAPLLSRLSLPAAWRVVVVQDGAQSGLSGRREALAMSALAPLPRAAAAEICHQVLMRVLPGAAAADFPAFAAGIVRVQQLLGKHFAPAQGGSAYTSAAVGQLLRWLEQTHCGPGEPSHAAAVGQSSWGPTGFAILPSQAVAEATVAAARAAGQVPQSLQIDIVAARDRGATITRR